MYVVRRHRYRVVHRRPVAYKRIKRTKCPNAAPRGTLRYDTRVEAFLTKKRIPKPAGRLPPNAYPKSNISPWKPPRCSCIFPTPCAGPYVTKFNILRISTLFAPARHLCQPPRSAKWLLRWIFHTPATQINNTSNNSRMGPSAPQKEGERVGAHQPYKRSRDRIENDTCRQPHTQTIASTPSPTVRHGEKGAATVPSPNLRRVA